MSFSQYKIMFFFLLFGLFGLFLNFLDSFMDIIPFLNFAGLQKFYF